MVCTEREEIERFLVDEFKGKIHRLSVLDCDVINKYKNNNFGFSLCAFMLYANGINPKSRSDFAPLGLLYYDGDNIFSIGIFKRTQGSDNVYVHIIAPNGNSWHRIIKKMSSVLSCSFKNVIAIYVRHIDEDDYNILIKNGYQPICDRPWHIDSHSEDETFNHRYIELEKIIGKNNNELFVKNLDMAGSRNFRTKTRSAFNRFSNFLAGNSFILEFYNYTSKYKNAAQIIVCNNFELFHPKGSSVSEDYANLLNKAFYDGENIFSYIGFIKKNNTKEKMKKKPVAFFVGEKISKDCVALYATLSATKNPPKGLSIKKQVGYTALSQYCYVKIFENLYSTGIRYVDLGGSENEQLNTFKRQLGAIEKKTYWAVNVLRKEDDKQ